MLLALALACAPEPCPAGSSRGADDLCVLDDAGDSGIVDSGAADGGDGADGSGDGTDGTEPASDCPATPHQPGDVLDDYADYPVYIDGTDRRFQTIQDGIWGAEDGDTVVVCPGLYDENIDFKGKVITVTSAAGPWETTIDGGGRASVVSLRNWEPPESVLQGFTIQGGEGSEFHGGGVFVEWGSPTIRYNLITGNTAGIAGGVYVRNGGAIVHNNLIVGNHASEGGGGMVCTACVGPFSYNTFYENTCRQGHVGEYFWGTGDFVGNLMVAKDDETGFAFRVMDWREDRDFKVAYNLLWPADIAWGGSFDGERWEDHLTDGLRADPMLVDPEAGDFTLSPGSPAIDAGPADMLDPDGSRADLGAFGGPDGAWPW